MENKSINGDGLMSGKDEFKDREMDRIQRDVALLQERAKRLREERFNLPTPEKIAALVKAREDLRELQGEKIDEIKRNILNSEVDLMKNIVEPLYATLNWRRMGAGEVRAKLPDVVVEAIVSLFRGYHTINFNLTEIIKVKVYNRHVSLIGRGSIEYAIIHFNMDKTDTEKVSKGNIKQQQDLVLREKRRLDSLSEEHKRIYGE